MKKTIGISPLEEYLSSSKNSKAQKDPDPVAPMQEADMAMAMNEQTREVKEAASSSSVPSQEAHSTQQNALELNLTPDAHRGEQLSLDNFVNPQQGAANAKQRITLHISAEIIDRVKNAVYWEPGLTIAGFAEEALEKALNELEAERGAAFPRRKQHRLRGGRPLI